MIYTAIGRIDLLALSQDAVGIKDIMLKHGYELIHESDDILNFAGKKFELGRVDFLLAHRKYTLEMLRRAEEESILAGKIKVKVLKIEDLIGLKIQASANDSNRLEQDTADIKSLIRDHRDIINMNIVREYFALFNRQNELDDIIRGMKDAK